MGWETRSAGILLGCLLAPLAHAQVDLEPLLKKDVLQTRKISPTGEYYAMTVPLEDPEVCAHCGSKAIRQDEATLDTWFSSALWPFSTLGWPDDTEDLRRFYPTSVMETGYDIIFLWVARMIMMGIFALDDVPFEWVYFHGTVRDD